MSANRGLLIDAWVARDELYSELFGRYAAVSPSRYQAPSEVAPAQDAGGDPGGSGDPGDQENVLSILTYAPEPTRPYWTYVTAGLSSPWLQESPLEVSAFGCELMIKSPAQEDWPATVLRTLSFYLLNHAGTLSPGVRLSLDRSIYPGTDSELANMFVWYADEAPDCWYQLPSGGFGIFAVIGITADELAFAESIEEYGTWAIQEVLRRAGVGQVTDPSRKSVVARQELAEEIGSVRAYANNFRMMG